MKPFPTLPRLHIALLLSVVSIWTLHADITVRLSVKFILNSDGTRPLGIGTNPTFQAEVDRGNGILAATGRGFRLTVEEYLDIQPPAPAGEDPGYWFVLGARSNRDTMENAAMADPAQWRWNTRAINIYVNNSSSGQCSFVGNGNAISLGANIVTGTVLHEIGHFFDLRHTHAGDPDCSIAMPPFAPSDGDSLAATIDDHNCLSTRDDLSKALFGGKVFSSLSPGELAWFNTAWLNVMSYHQEDQLLGEQMDIWAHHANNGRLFVCSGRTWFVAATGADILAGDHAATPFATVSRAISSVGTADDVILLRAGHYASPGTIAAACTLRATHGEVVLGSQSPANRALTGSPTIIPFTVPSGAGRSSVGGR